MVTQKDRRRNGYCTPRTTISKKSIIENDFFINPLYDDWSDYRDGLRNQFGDFKKVKKVFLGYRKFNKELFEKRMKMNKKQKRLLQIRKARSKVFNKYDL